jgi:hypothetical protein
VGADDNFCPKCGERFDGLEDDAGKEVPAGGDVPGGKGKAE